MRVLVQRASQAQVTVEGEVVGRLPSPGLVLLVGVTHDDTAAVAEKLARKVWGLRILDAEVSAVSDQTQAAGPRTELSASDLGAPLLVVSQFTLYGDARKGRRPTWEAAAGSAVARPLFDHFVESLRGLGAHVETGTFGAMMEVSLTNHGPVTLLLET